MATQVGEIQRTTSAVSTLFHDNFVNEVKSLLKYMDPFAELFSEMGPGGYSFSGTQITSALDDNAAVDFQGTDGYHPDSSYFEPFEWSATCARAYLRRAADEFIVHLGQGNGVYQNYEERLTAQALDAVRRKVGFHVHGSANATVATFVSRTSSTILVVDAGLGHAGQDPTHWLYVGAVLALLNANSSHTTIGVAKVASWTFDSATGQATITFASAIDSGSDGADGDPLVFATSDDSSANNYGVERGYAPNGALNIFDPNESQSTFQGVTLSSHTKWDPARKVSYDWGHVELTEFAEQVAVESNMPVSTESHVVTMHTGAKIEVAKGLLQYQQQSNLGRELQGGWKTVRVGEYDLLASPYHIWDVAYFVDPDSIHVVEPFEPQIWVPDGSEKNRIPDYDGWEWVIRWYGQRLTTTRNRLGVITGIANPNKYNFRPNV